MEKKVDEEKKDEKKTIDTANVPKELLNVVELNGEVKFKTPLAPAELNLLLDIIKMNIIKPSEPKLVIPPQGLPRASGNTRWPFTNNGRK